MNPQPGRRSAALVRTAIAGALVLGGGLGATAVALTHDPGKTIVRQVTVPASGASLASNGALSVAQISKSASRGTVEIVVQGSGSAAEGSGFVYDSEGHIVTNAHVVEGSTSYTVVFPDGKRVQATLVGSDPSTDLAVLKVNVPASQLHPLTLADSGAVLVGDGVVAIGSPFGLENTVTTGIVSALNREIQAPDGSAIENAIQTDAAINHGNSGGPLLDLNGHVIGINSQINSQSGGNDGVGFAIPSSTVRTIAGQLIATGKVQHGYLGVSVSDKSAGVAVNSVQPGSAAARAGLKSGDVITALDGKKVTSAQLRTAISARKPGTKVELTVLRSGSSRTVTVTLGQRPA